MPALDDLLPDLPGTYVLVLHSTIQSSLAVGRRLTLTIEPGYYLYVGSAFGPGGLRARISRHCRLAKSKHWHIDYLREHTTPMSIWYDQSKQRLEHHWARRLQTLSEMTPVEEFGCSDCDCSAHLFLARRRPTADALTTVTGRPVRVTDLPTG